MGTADVHVSGTADVRVSGIQSQSKASLRTYVVRALPDERSP